MKVPCGRIKIGKVGAGSFFPVRWHAPRREHLGGDVSRWFQPCRVKCLLRQRVAFSALDSKFSLPTCVGP